MVLSDRDIKAAIAEKRIVITPQPDFRTQLGTCSIDLRLGNVFRVFNHSSYPYIDPSKKDYTSEITKKVIVKNGKDFIMQPGDFALAATLERVKIPDNMMGRLEGRSSLGRIGIVVHSTASIFDAGWDGNCVLELGNLGRMAVKLTPGMRICAMSFEELSSPAEVPYSKKKDAKYKTQKEPLESKFHEEK
ncbi:MAG: dCTP deaminase [Candidatus Levybacteria bacterium RIFCSPHIGHO2_02_FULL_39_36]|uniref:dCTP deaminase n=1 Tax=Candidatus Woesebacteria bacterium GW2011_GWA1_43_12 TaxID=1618557 RepID=A0A0G1CWF0_9BACT|nr:MAG: Deoxycytidine triphosphate deaminase [Candidatus Levybacteria bacterium GW2011_GWB1_39_7]KKR25653.1 MAG: Deoxycytidine triphosphate deaminase [Microgenomates group bacterium GW2011_GWC1_39_7]KKS90080.1 MAG: Deoxycytidine triphosphate deaminase [Candidatus Woesebacteria bacterium GW2011_GWA1_43_12]OGH25776.1 MAG: dCTP deaminase [Candidatus Levybacteria bacterium RIFCSPHIGHO2_12_FULL_39_39]OGH27464.1 MAG: dCTP deaminase [Candidatus Levybacteria bacterium RIFCSPHIGHO2_02_FULL_39_36]OGH470